MPLNTSTPLISVIISSYNHAQYVEQSIISVLTQTYKNIELLVVDDGSTDNSVDIIQKLHQKCAFDFKSQKNRGLSKTLNDCIARSQGSLIAPFGSDDVMLPTRIATQVAYMQDKPEVGICAGNIQSIDQNGEPLSKRDRHRPFIRLDFEDVFLGQKPGAPAPTLMFRREALEKVGGFDPTIPLEDLLIQLKITNAGYFIDVLETVLAQYRIHDTNTYKNIPFMVDNVLKTYTRFNKHPEYEKVCNRFINSMFLKCARKDKKIAYALLQRLPLRYWNNKTFRGIGRLLFHRSKSS